MQASAIVSEDLQQMNLLPKVILLEKNSSGLMEKKKNWVECFFYDLRGQMSSSICVRVLGRT